MLFAKKLKVGDTIAIVNSSNKLGKHHRDELNKTIDWLETLGFKVHTGKHMFSVDKDRISAGSVEERVEDINFAIQNPEFKAIWFFTGGLAASELLPFIDYGALEKNPKIILGMSDPDNFHFAFNKQLDLVTFTSCDPKMGRRIHLDFSYSQKMFKERLIDGKTGLIEASGDRASIRSGVAQGKLFGCNMTVLAGLMGTQYLPDFKGKILCLDTFYSDTRTLRWRLSQLKLVGAFDQIVGIVIGHQEDFNKNYDYITSFEETVLDITKEFDFPILKVSNFGHRCPNAFLPLGAQVKMDADKLSLELVEKYLI